MCYDLSVQYKMQKFTFALSKRFRPKHNVPVRENKLFIGTGSILAGDKSCVLPTEPHLLKKKCPWTQSMTGGPWTQSMKVVHGPSPKWVHVLSSPVLTILCILSIINVSLCLCVLINQIAGRFIVLFEGRQLTKLHAHRLGCVISFFICLIRSIGGEGYLNQSTTLPSKYH